MSSQMSKAPAVFRQVEGAFIECLGLRVLPGPAHTRAWSQAAVVLDAAPASAYTRQISGLAFATGLFTSLAVELAARPLDLGQLIDQLGDAVDVPRVVLARQVLASPQLLRLPSSISIQVELALVLAFTNLCAVSLWAYWPGGDLRHIGHSGDFDPRLIQTRNAARRVLSDDSLPTESNSSVCGIKVERHEQKSAAVVGRGNCACAPERVAIMEAAAPVLAAMMDREELDARVSGSDQAQLDVSEKRLARIRFDLHDGPQQDVILLAQDLGLFRTQLESVVARNPDRERVFGRLEDLQARLVALDGDLRRISAFVQSPFLQSEPLPDVLAQLTDDFATRTGITPGMRLAGDFRRLTDSQQIALVGLIREALSNVREHSDAQNVTIEVTSDGDGISATVQDDGHGFDPEVTLVKAARDGHLGLVGMHERVRLLGGRTQIDSRPGGPTVISISLPLAPS